MQMDPDGAAKDGKVPDLDRERCPLERGFLQHHGERQGTLAAPSGWDSNSLPAVLPRQGLLADRHATGSLVTCPAEQGQGPTLPQQRLPNLDLAAWIPSPRFLIPSGDSSVGERLPPRLTGLRRFPHPDLAALAEPQDFPRISIQSGSRCDKKLDTIRQSSVGCSR